jgi:preprotein translocase subunit YajC
MDNNLFMLAQAAPPKGGLNDPIFMLVLMVGFIAFFYFFVVRPQNKKKKESENMLKSMKPGDKVVTIGGAHGKIVSIKEDTITIRVDDKAEITFEKSAISRVIDPNAPVKAVDSKKEKSKDVKETVENKGSSENSTQQKQ